VKSKVQFMAAYRAARAAPQNHAIDDMEPWEIWVGIGLGSVVYAASEISLERYTHLFLIGRLGISVVAAALVCAVFFAIRKRRVVKHD